MMRKVPCEINDIIAKFCEIEESEGRKKNRRLFQGLELQSLCEDLCFVTLVGRRSWRQRACSCNFLFQRRARQFAPERAVLQRSEQGVEFGEVRAVMDLELVDLGDAGGEGALA